MSTPSDDNSGQGESVANRYRFGRFVLDTASQQLFGDDDSTTELPLSPKAFRVLTLLVENVGDVITKDQLLDEVWADTVVLEGVVKVCIAELRRALGERAARPHHLHTVQRRGYRFEGPVVLEARPVQRAEAATVPVPASSSSAPAPMARRSIRQSGPTPPTHGELRQLAIIYCEVTERQALAANIGDEATAKLVDAAHQTCLAIVRSLGGSIAQPLDGGLIAYFGYPTAYEDDTNRALRVALRILERTAALNARQARRDEPGSQPGLELGIGVHSGSVEVGAGGDVSGIPREQVVGIAERLARIGSPGTLSITSSTSRLVHGAYELQPIGEHAITDEQEPIRVLRVVKATGMQSRLDLTDTAKLTPLVGRDQEISLILDRWQSTRERRGQGMLLSGEAGMGKSRLVHALRNEIGGERHSWMELRASAFHRNSPFHPVRGLLKEAFLLGEDDAPEEQVARLEMALEQTGLPVDECLPLMAELLGLPLPVDHPPLELAPELQRQQTLEMLCAWIFGLAEQQPLVLIVEDLHWADPSTIELVGLLVAQVPMVPVLLIITQRPDFEPSFASQPHLAVLPLNALSQKHVDSMVASLAGGKTVPRNIRDHVLERADGVPLFIEELTRSVLESDLLEEGDTGWETTDPLPHFAVPDTLQDTLEARLDRLGPAREIAQLAAAIGRDFSQALLAEVSGMDPAELDEQLADLVEAGLVHRRGLPPRAHYAFKHALIQETAYLAMLPETRKLYHARIARTLERATGSPSAVEPDGIARHYAQAGRLTEAVTAYETAGRQANSRSASLEAIAHYRAALAALVEQPPGAQRDLREVGLQVALGEPMVSALGSGNVEVEATYARARELSQDLNATIGLADALDGLVTFYITQSRLDEAVEFASQQLDVAEVLNSDELRIRAHFSLAIIHYFLGDASKALGHFEQIDAIFDPALHRELVTIRGENIGAVSRAWCSWTLWMLGLPDQALAAATTGVQRARDVGNPFSVAFALAWQTGVHWNCRQIDDCAKSANACIEVSEKRGFPIPLGIARLALLRCVGGTEDADRRIAEAESALVSLGATGTQIAVPQILGGLADFCLDCGRPDTAAAYIDAAFALSERTGQPHWDSELYRCKGEVLLAQDPTNHEKAEALFRRAVGTAADQRARMLELRTTTRLCQLLHETGRSDEARERLSKIYGQFGEGLGLPDLKAARGLLDTLG